MNIIGSARVTNRRGSVFLVEFAAGVSGRLVPARVSRFIGFGRTVLLWEKTTPEAVWTLEVADAISRALAKTGA